jgi:hypothetical protein
MLVIRAQRLWSSLLAVCVPSALAVIVWSVFFGGRLIAAGLAACYLLVVLAARLHAAERERRARPERLERVRGQLDRVIASTPSPPAQPVELPAKGASVIEFPQRLAS